MTDQPTLDPEPAEPAEDVAQTATGPMSAEELAEHAEAIVNAVMRQRRLTAEQADDLFRALCIPCPDRPFGCGKPALEMCVHIVDGKPLGVQVAHLARLKNSGREYEPVPEHERTISPEAIRDELAEKRARQANAAGETWQVREHESQVRDYESRRYR